MTVDGSRPADEPAWEPAPVPLLRRWEESGAVWQVVAEGRAALTIALLTCDGGEEVARFRCDRAAVTGLLTDDDDR